MISFAGYRTSWIDIFWGWYKVALEGGSHD
jgi:hypothetical protein